MKTLFQFILIVIYFPFIASGLIAGLVFQAFYGGFNKGRSFTTKAGNWMMGQ